jgi:hypothetical protein
MRSFADPKERLNVIPRLGAPGPTAPYVTKIVNVLVECDYYTLVHDTGEEHFVVEQTYAEIEGRPANDDPSVRRRLQAASRKACAQRGCAPQADLCSGWTSRRQ